MASPVSLSTIPPPTTLDAHAPAAGKQSTAPAASAAPVATPEKQGASEAISTSSPNGAPSTVSISSAGQQALAESRETSTQTSREAARGDQQAVHLLAKQAAAKAAITG